MGLITISARDDPIRLRCARAATLYHALMPRGMRARSRARLVDGTTGYFVRAPRTDDCFAAALATTLQIPISRVPDPRIDERLDLDESVEDVDAFAHEQLERWLARRQLRLVVHQKMPARRRRWIGIVPLPGNFHDHCLVMSRGEILFDPAQYGPRVTRRFEPSDVALGLSFQTIPQAKE